MTYTPIAVIIELARSNFNCIKIWNDPRFWNYRHFRRYDERICFPPCRDCLFFDKDYDTFNLVDDGGDGYILVNQNPNYCVDHPHKIDGIPLVLIYLKMLYIKAYPDLKYGTTNDAMSLYDKEWQKYLNSHVYKQAMSEINDFVTFLAINLTAKEKIQHNKLYRIAGLSHDKIIVTYAANVIEVIDKLLRNLKAGNRYRCMPPNYFLKVRSNMT